MRAVGSVRHLRHRSRKLVEDAFLVIHEPEMNFTSMRRCARRKCAKTNKGEPYETPHNYISNACPRKRSKKKHVRRKPADDNGLVQHLGRQRCHDVRQRNFKTLTNSVKRGMLPTNQPTNQPCADPVTWLHT